MNDLVDTRIGLSTWDIVKGDVERLFGCKVDNVEGTYLDFHGIDLSFEDGRTAGLRVRRAEQVPKDRFGIPTDWTVTTKNRTGVHPDIRRVRTDLDYYVYILTSAGKPTSVTVIDVAEARRRGAIERAVAEGEMRARSGKGTGQAFVRVMSQGTVLSHWDMAEREQLSLLGGVA